MRSLLLLICLLPCACAVAPRNAPPEAVRETVRAGEHEFERQGLNAQGYHEFRRVRDGAEVVLVPAGHFHKRAYWDTPGTLEREDGHWEHLDAFLMDKYEVTNAQVAEFLRQSDARLEDGRATGPDDRPWAVTHPWGLRITERGAEVQPGYERHPAVGVSGWLALAYAHWVGGDLPTGTEYEKAAAGPSGLLFPWGDETQLPDSRHANSYLHGPRRTMPVGSYPDGVSPYGLYDMAGNTYSRAYWEDAPTADERLETRMPTMLKGGAWVSPNWWNLRCVCRCGQSMDAMDGSVGFRVIARDMDVLDALQEPGPSLRVFRNTEDAYREAELRNVPIFLYLGYERCGQCDRVQAQLFRDPEFVAYCNANLVVLIGHSTRDWNDLPKTPLTADGVFFAHTNAYLAELHQVFEDFSVRRDPALGPLPEHVSLFQISPSFNLLNPHRHLITYPEDAVLASEQDLWTLKRGMAEGWREKFEEAQAQLGPHLTLEEFENNAPLPNTTWGPTPEDAQMWRQALASMRELHAALALHFDDAGEYPDSLFELRQHFAGLRLPQDPFRGTYFRYERTPDGYTLTCHGAGDRPGGTEIPEKDIVFTQAGMQE